jgi:hypothetical protein
MNAHVRCTTDTEVGDRVGLLPGDLEKVPENFGMKECYSRIYSWHKEHGRQRLRSKYKREDKYSEKYLKLVNALPSPDRATVEDMAFVFGEVIYMLMEWAYHEEDEFGIKTAAYAHFALNKFFGNRLQQLQEKAKKSSLHDQFSHKK